MTENKLYVIPGSHPSLAASLMLERKGVPFKTVDMICETVKAAGSRAELVDLTRLAGDVSS